MQINQLDEADQIKNGSIAVCEKVIKGNIQAHNHNFYETELFLSSGGSYTVDGKAFPIKKGSLFFLSPLSFHSCVFPEGTHLFNIMFTPNLADVNLLYCIFSDEPYVHAEIPEGRELDFFCSLCSEMVRYTEEKHPLSFTVPLLNSLLGKIFFLGEQSSRTPEALSPIRRTALHIQSNFNKNISLEEAASVAGMSKGYFCDRFRSATGTTFKQYLLNVRFAYAKKLLRYTDLSITEVALESGFNDFSNFMYMFKKSFSKTPRQYRVEAKG